jgi:predicted nucleotidyltransferase
MKQDFDKTIRIPVVTDLVRAGNPDVVEQAKNHQVHQQRRETFEQRLKERIEELQVATGQDEYSGLARAHAIRSEGNVTPLHKASKLDPAFEKYIDQARDELIRELSSLPK